LIQYPVTPTASVQVIEEMLIVSDEAVSGMVKADTVGAVTSPVKSYPYAPAFHVVRVFPSLSVVNVADKSVPPVLSNTGLVD